MQDITDIMYDDIIIYSIYSEIFIHIFFLYYVYNIIKILNNVQYIYNLYKI